MNRLHKDPQRALLNPLLIKKGSRRQALRVIKKNRSDPITQLISEKLVVEKNFYKNLASSLGLPYLESLPVALTSTKSLHQIVPSDLLISNQCFVYKQGQYVVLACFNPFNKEGLIPLLKTYTSLDSVRVVITSHQEIRRVLQEGYYFDANITSEDIVSVMYPKQSTRGYKTAIVPNVFPFASIFVLGILLLVYPWMTLGVMFGILNLAYFVINPYKLYIFLRSLRPKYNLFIKEGSINKQIKGKDLPVYTILVPLRDEAEIANQIVSSMLSIDYPTHLLDIKFIVDVDDTSTINAIKSLGIGLASKDTSSVYISTELVVVPKGTIATKPRATDYALFFARGALTTIYDAEDKPQVDQLKKVVLGFDETPLDTVCIQARLNYYNSRQNTLTKLFSLEYGFWFDYYLPGLQEARAPIPLGGTSNHFITSRLKKLGSWDAFNVTEDADLGLRIFRNGLNTAVINSYTFEEANSKLGNWIRQRTRWQKGFLITFLVHTAHPFKLIEDLGVKRFILSMITFGGNFFLPFFNPILWLILILSLLSSSSILPNPEIISLIALFNLVIGNLTYLITHLISAIKSKRYDLTIYSLLLPFYWVLISVATWRAAWQFFKNPYQWEKTKHGLTVVKK